VVLNIYDVESSLASINDRVSILLQILSSSQQWVNFPENQRFLQLFDVIDFDGKSACLLEVAQ
jgi:hypothetical protein